MTDAGEEQLRAAAAGDADALVSLLRQHGPAVRRQLHISPAWRAGLDVADVMQVTYLEAFLRIDRLEARTEEAFLAWLTRLAENNLRDGIKELRRKKRPDPRRRLRKPTAVSDSTLLKQISDPWRRTPSRCAAQREWQQTMEAALAKLPPLYAQVLRLHDIEGQAVVDVAAVLGRTPGAVYMLRARALERLQELLGPASRFFSDGA